MAISAPSFPLGVPRDAPVVYRSRVDSRPTHSSLLPAACEWELTWSAHVTPRDRLRASSASPSSVLGWFQLGSAW
eukprot:5056250-Amphidinium_carterae.1